MCCCASKANGDGVVDRNKAGNTGEVAVVNGVFAIGHTNRGSGINTTKPGTLAYNFLNSDQALAYILFSIKSMATDELASARMGTGLETGDTEEEHDCFSDLSHIAIYNNFVGVTNAFYGRYNGQDGHGIGDLLRTYDANLYDEIDSRLTAIEAELSEIHALGEQADNPIRFDQIIGEGLTDPKGVNWVLANNASLNLVDLGSYLEDARDVMALSELSPGSGEGD